MNWCLKNASDSGYSCLKSLGKHRFVPISCCGTQGTNAILEFWEMTELVEFLRWSNPLELCLDHFPGQLSSPGCINKDPTVWLDGARPPPKYIFKIKMSLKNSKV